MRYAARGKIIKPTEEEMVRQAHHPEQGRRTNSNEQNTKSETASEGDGRRQRTEDRGQKKILVADFRL